MRYFKVNDSYYYDSLRLCFFSNKEFLNMGDTEYKTDLKTSPKDTNAIHPVIEAGYVWVIIAISDAIIA